MFKKFTAIIIFIVIFTLSTLDADKSCNRKIYKNDLIVCSCNATYCDEISRVVPLRKQNYVHVTTNLKEFRLQKIFGKMEKEQPPPIASDIYDVLLGNDLRIRINREVQFQTIIGFGGSFTDSVGINLKKLSEETQSQIMNAYFGENGLEYNMARVPIGGTDFSERPYTYNDYPDDDTTLSNFSLTMEDFKYKIPYIKKAKEIATDKLLLVASSWSPPSWMKTSKNIKGTSKLLTKYYQIWADYHIRFLDEYKKNGLQFWAMTTGNEPGYRYLPWTGLNSLGWSPDTQAKWIAENFGPTVRQSNHSSILLIGLDGSRHLLPWWITRMHSNSDAMKYLDGIATHWYLNEFVSPSVLDTIHNLHPDKFLISTEACSSNRPWHVEANEKKAWNRAVNYVREMIEDLNHWITGWIDWNLVLDSTGGPNWTNHFVDAAIIIRNKKKDFVKLPVYYAMGHFSKFIPRGSKRVDVVKLNNDLDCVAFLRPDEGIVVVFYNQYNYEKSVIIEEEGKGHIQLRIIPNSIHTVLYW